jgi:Family of unknown function (DUF6152)
MTMRIGSGVLLAALASVATAALAHHSAAQFDFAQTVRIEGVVKEMRVANPHIALFLEITDDKGTRVIEYEGHSRNNVYRRGWRPEMVHTGDTIGIDIAPMRSGEDGGYVKTFITKDGTEFYSSSRLALAAPTCARRQQPSRRAALQARDVSPFSRSRARRCSGS